MSASDHELLGQFSREQAQDAFTALVNRHLNLVYSAALRQVRSPQLAEEVSQFVFTQLAHHAASLTPDTILTAWLYQVTRRAAIDVVRREARRQAREQIAFKMSEMQPAPSADWTHIEPLLDEAMHSLEDLDRTAILLRYFENKSLREVGLALGVSEDAAQKRVSRAVEHLREFFSRQEIAVGAGGLAMLISTHAVQSAPVGLSATVAAGSALSASSFSVSTTAAVAKTLAMTTIQKTIVAAVIVGAVGFGAYETQRASALREQVQALTHQTAQQAALSNTVRELQRERDRATNALAALAAENAAVKKNPAEVLKLRGEVGRLRKENTQIASTNALSKVTADPEARRLLRDQQKTGMGAIYKNLAQQLKLNPEQTDKLNDMLADGVMEGVGLVTTVLRDKPAPDQMNSLFAAHEAALQDQVRELLGPDAFTQFQDYTHNLLGNITSLQFQNLMNGGTMEKTAKAEQLNQAIREESKAVLAEAGLPADYQTLPILNFRNIASEEAGERSIKLMDEIYQRAATRLDSVLTKDDVAKFQEFRKTAINNVRSTLTVNRVIMAPIAN